MCANEFCYGAESSKNERYSASRGASEVPATGESVSYVAIAGASLILLAGAAFVLSKRMVREEK